MVGALNSVKVIDLTHVLAGPFCTYQLALLGADVIKIEAPDAPDCARGRGPDAAGNAAGLGLNYQVQGANKRSLALDLRSDRGADLLRDADILVENYATGALTSLGLGYEQFLAENPALIYCSITGYGDTGPQAQHGAYDNVIQAVSGTITQCGGIKPGVSFVDYATGYAAAFAVMSALHQRRQTGQGTHVSVSMLEVALQMMAPEAAAAQYEDAPRRGTEPGISSYETANGQVMLGAFHPAQYRKLAQMLAGIGLAVPYLADIHTWSDVWEIPAQVKARLREVFAQKTSEDWVGLLRAADIPAETVRTLSQAVGLPQVQARKFYRPSPDTPQVSLPTTAFRMGTGGAQLHRGPPKHGEHTRSVLEEMGLSDADITQFYAQGIVV